MKHRVPRIAAVVAPAIAFALLFTAPAGAQQFNNGYGYGPHFSQFRGFVPGSIVVSGTVYTGNADTVTSGELLPPGCQPGTVNVPLLAPSTGTTAVAVTCGSASDNGEAPNLRDNHNVWNNANTDPNFGVTSPIVLWDISPTGFLLGRLDVPSDGIVTSFSSKSELALNRSADGRSLTFMGYRGGPGCPALTLDPATGILTQGTQAGPTSPTAANLLDVSASSTPGLCDPTNPAVASYTGANSPTAYFRSVAEVDAHGFIFYTDGDAYSGDNSRASMLADSGLYYSAGNDNNGNLSKKQMGETELGFNLSHSTGAELFFPGAAPLVPPANNMVSYFAFSGDKPGKDTNFRGLTIHDDTLYVAKGSGGNGINTVYQLGAPGELPTPQNAASLGGTVNEPYTILPGFPTSTSTTASTGGYYPFGLWFANDKTLYVCNEGDLSYTANQTINGQANVADSGTLQTAGLQKWVLSSASGSPTWVLQYTIQNGLNLGVPYSVRDYPASIEPATGGCRNITGVVNRDGTATIYAVTSTISLNGDNGADPNQVMAVTDQLSATQLPSHGYFLDRFFTVRPARAGVAYRGVALAPVDDRY